LEDSKFLNHEPCPKCGSKDNLARYEDGHGYCFGCDYYEHPEGGSAAPKTEERRKMTGLIEFEVATLAKRGIDEDTCKKWRYGVGEYSGRPVQVANYCDPQGGIVAQKLRFQDKTFRWVGDTTKVGLYGSHLWRDGGKMVTITEGELDALSLSQCFNLKWPVVSIPNGAKSASKVVAQNIEWLESFESVILCFDQDAQGRAAAIEAAQQLSPGKVKIVTSLPGKDANECLVKGHVRELIDAVYGAKAYRPDGVIPGEEVWEMIIKKDVRKSIPYPWDGLNKKLFGMRGGELVTLTAGTGIGKSSVTRELAHYLIKQGEKVGYIALEESIRKTSEQIMGLEMNCPPHSWETRGIEEATKRTAFDATVGSGQLVLYDHWGSIDPANLLNRIRYMARAMECKYIILDHLSIVVSAISEGDERRMIDNTMTKLRSLCEETGINLHVVSHLKRPEGRAHEEGGQTSLAQLRGSAAIGQLSDAVVGCERNQQDAATADRMILRILKNRYSGHTGIATTVEYDGDTGRLSEWIAPEVVDVPSRRAGPS
jgi:twinkle protein